MLRWNSCGLFPQKNSKFSRLELTAARHNLGTKQAELTFVAEDVFNKSVNADIDNRLAALGARDEIRNVSLEVCTICT